MVCYLYFKVLDLILQVLLGYLALLRHRLSPPGLFYTLLLLCILQFIQPKKYPVPKLLIVNKDFILYTLKLLDYMDYVFILKLHWIMDFDDIVQFLNCYISIWLCFFDHLHYLVHFVFVEKNLQKILLADWLKSLFVTEMFGSSEIASCVFEAFVVIYFFTVHLVVELFQDNIELLIINPRDVESGTFWTSLLAWKSLGNSLNFFI